MKTLLIGCGNIGAMYDINNKDIHSHAKALYLNNECVNFIEPNDSIANQVELKYNFHRENYDKEILKVYDKVIIATPTDYHFSYLLDSLHNNVPIIICEKPISYSIKELNELLTAYSKSNSKVFINYIRRFQTSYVKLKVAIATFNEPLQAVNCNYYKGIMNYASHAIDTINFLNSSFVNFENVKEHKRESDFFEKDPTISFSAFEDNIAYFFNGVNIHYPLWEVDMFFATYRVQLLKGGQEVIITQNQKVIKKINNAIKNYMEDVTNYSNQLLYKSKESDNFEESIQLNKMLINIINNKS